MSAKLKLALWVTFMVLILSSMVLVFVLVLNQNYLPSDPAEYLVNVVLDNADDVEFERGILELDDLDVYRRGVHCTFFREDGEVILSANKEGLDFLSLPFEENVVRTMEIDGDEYFIYDKYVDMTVSGLWIRGATLVHSSEGVMDLILRLTIILLPTILVLTFIGAMWISARTFRPMEKIVATANSIHDADDLTDRINLRHGSKEMKILARSFDRMFERLEELFNYERQFTSDASHELRTPTAIILAECERARNKNLDSQEYVQTIKNIENQGHRMSNLIDELLGITRLQQGTEKYPLVKSDLSEFVTMTAESFVPLDTRGIEMTLDIEEGIEACFNASLMSRAVYNLLENAYRYGREGGSVKLGLCKVEVQVDNHKDKYNSFAELTVADDGIGIREEDISHIWDRFWQAETPFTDENRGSGLGLAMVRGIAELHHGSISVSSKLGSGSTFTLHIPLG